MRGAALTVTLLLLLAPVGLAQDPDGEDGPESSSGSSSQSSSQSRSSSGEPAPRTCDDLRDPQMQERCLASCREDPEQAKCPPQDPADEPAGNGTEPQPRPDDAPRDGPHDGCREQDDDSAERHCEEQVRKLHDERPRQHIAFEVDAANATLLHYAIDGFPVLDAIHLGLDGGNLSIERQGSTLRVRDGDSELRLHDDPNGLIRFKGESGNVTFDFPAGARIVLAQQGARVLYEGGREGHLLADNATWLDNDTVRLDGFFAFHVPAGQPKAAEDAKPEVKEVEERKQEAIERRTLGAEVTLKPRGPQRDDALAAAANDSVEIRAYDDVEVHVDLPEQAAVDTPLRVVVSSELDEGRTIVLNVDEALLASTDVGDLVLRYFDLHNQTDGSVLETEVLFVQASSLQDVMSPDEAQPEYWVVEDANGIQVLVSVPHWSAHAITVASIATALKAPSVTVGIVAGAAASLVMGALLVWPRRRDDEL